MRKQYPDIANIIDIAVNGAQESLYKQADDRANTLRTPIARELQLTANALYKQASATVTLGDVSELCQRLVRGANGS